MGSPEWEARWRIMLWADPAKTQGKWNHQPKPWWGRKGISKCWGHLCFARTCQCPKSYHTADPLKKHEENLKFLLPFICQNCWGFVCLWPLTQQLPFHIWVQFWHIDIFCLVKCWTCNWVGWKPRNVQRFLDHWRGKYQHVPKLGGQMAKRSQMRFIMVHYWFIEDRTCP